MLETSAITSTSNTGTKLAGPNQALGQEQFLNLLIAQLRNQDPLNPVDNTQMIAQLAQFSQLEQTKQMTTSLNTFIDQQTNANATGLVSLIGRKVTASGSTLALTPGTGVPLSYQLAGNASKVAVQILNSAGIPVRNYVGVNQAAGNQGLVWDGRDNNGNALPAGLYAFTVTAVTANGTAVAANTRSTGVVTGIQYTGSGPTVVLDSGIAIGPTQILSVQ